MQENCNDWNAVIIMNAKKIIKEKGLLQKSVASKAGITELGFSNMLNGRKTILAKHIPNIAAALGVSPNQLFSISDDTNDPKSA